MTLLQSYIDNVREAEGLVHKARIMGLRSYLKSLSIEDFKEQVVLMDKPENMNTLWEAGLDKYQQAFVLRRIEEIRARQDRRLTD